MADLHALSSAIGWLYTIAWSVSFYPQAILNHRRKSVTGLSLEFQLYNISGYVFYTIYTYTNYVTQHDKKLGLTQSVEVNDLVFATHGLLMQSFTIWQCARYKLKSHSINRWHIGLVLVFWLLFAYNLALCAGGILPFVNRVPEYRYSVVEYLGYVKVCISFVKYCPQAYMNWARQSTVGWSVGNVLLDLCGGLLAFGQQALEAYRKGDASEFTSNVAKLLLSIESVCFDLLFIVQHYVLYRHNNAAAEAAAARLGSLSIEEQEALEAETAARAREHAALLVPGALLGKSAAEYESVDGARSPAAATEANGSPGAPSHDRHTAAAHDHENDSVNGRGWGSLADDPHAVDLGHIEQGEATQHLMYGQRRSSDAS